MPPRFADRLAAGPVVLRRRRPRDVPELRAAIERSVAEVGAFLRWARDGVPSREELAAAVAARAAEFDAGTGFEFVLREAWTGEVVGEVGCDLRDAGAVAEIGYWVRTDRTGRGYATAAAAALTSALFGTLPSVGRVEIRADKGNVRSHGVPRRLGFRLVGEETFAGERLAGQTGEGYVWSVSRAEWAARRP